MRRSRTRRSTSAALLLLGLAAAASAGDYKYEPKLKACEPTSGYAGTLAKQITFRQTGPPNLHLIAREWLDQTNHPNPDDNHGRGVHYTYDGTSWSPGTAFTRAPLDSFPNGRRSTDFRFVVDEDDDVHVAYEAHHYGGSFPELFIAYKDQEDGSQWAPGGDPTNLGVGHSPRVALQTTGGDEVIHVVFGGTGPFGPGEDEWTLHNRRNADGEWEGVTYVTDAAYPRRALGSILVDSSGHLHLIADKVGDANQGEPKPVWVKHFEGTFADTSAYWDTVSVYTLDTYFIEPASGETAEQSDAAYAVSFGETSGQIHAVWARLNDSPLDSPDQERMIAFRTRVSGVWEPVKYLSREGDGLNSGFPTLTTDGNVVHVFWQDQGPTGRKRLKHVFSDDPADPDSWSPIMEVFPDVAKGARRPTVVAASGKVYVAAFDSTDGWFRTGSVFTGELPRAPAAVSEGVYFRESDVTVGPGSTLMLQEGAVLSFADEDVAQAGEDTVRAELSVQGALEIAGSPSKPAMLSSPGGRPGSWAGVLFVDDWTDLSVSSLSEVVIEDAVFGAKLDSLACTLYRPRFSQIDSAEVFVPRDTRLSAGHEWNLEAPTEVVVAGASGTEPRIGIVINGHLETSDPGDTGEVVKFTATPGDPLTGNAWQGVTVQGTGWPGDGVGTADIEDAEFEYAAYPLAFFLADTLNGTGPRVAHSEFHHYHDEAILDWASDALVDSNLVYRGLGMAQNAEIGRVGIHKASSAGRVVGNKVFWQGERGIWADYTSGYCIAATPTKPTEVLPIKLNDVIGTPPDPSLESGIGVDVSWACREQNVEVKNNNIQEWPDVGVKVRQSSDVVISCNCILGNGSGVFHRRDKVDWDEEEDGYSVLASNLVKKNGTNVRTFLNGPRGELSGRTAGICGGGGSMCPPAGENLIWLLEENETNWDLDGANEVRTDYAQGNLWTDQDGTPLSDTSSPTIEETNDWNWQIHGQEIDTSGYLSSGGASCVDEGLQCVLLIDPSNPVGGRAWRPEFVPISDAEAGGKSSAGPAADAGLPTVLRFHAPRPNPARDRVHLRMDVPLARQGPAEVTIYNAAGRRVGRVLCYNDGGSGAVGPPRRGPALGGEACYAF